MGKSYTFKGRVVSVGKTERLGKDPNRPFLKRTAVIDDAEVGDKYPNPVPFEVSGEYCALFDQLVVGAIVEVVFVLNGREWKDKQGKIIDCTQKGYKLGDRVIRFSKVVVGA